MSMPKVQLAQALAAALRRQAERGIFKRAPTEAEIAEEVQMLMTVVDRYAVSALVEQMQAWQAQARVHGRKAHARALEWMTRDLRLRARQMMTAVEGAEKR